MTGFRKGFEGRLVLGGLEGRLEGTGSVFLSGLGLNIDELEGSEEGFRGLFWGVLLLSDCSDDTSDSSDSDDSVGHYKFEYCALISFSKYEFKHLFIYTYINVYKLIYIYRHKNPSRHTNINTHIIMNLILMKKKEILVENLPEVIDSVLERS